jgi:hypothetical protein
LENQPEVRAHGGPSWFAMQRIFAYSQRQLLNPIPDGPSYIHARKQKVFVNEQVDLRKFVGDRFVKAK